MAQQERLFLAHERTTLTDLASEMPSTTISDVAKIATLAALARGSAIPQGKSLEPPKPTAQVPAAQPRRTIRSVEQDEHGHWVMVEREVEEEEVTATFPASTSVVSLELRLMLDRLLQLMESFVHWNH